MKNNKFGLFGLLGGAVWLKKRSNLVLKEKLNNKNLMDSLSPMKEFEGHFPCKDNYSIMVVFIIEGWHDNSNRKTGWGRIELTPNVTDGCRDQYDVDVTWDSSTREIKMHPKETGLTKCKYMKFGFNGTLLENNVEIGGGITNPICENII